MRVAFIHSVHFSEPPEHVAAAIFPFIEKAEENLRLRVEKEGQVAKDQALTYMLEMMRWLRRVLVQDAAALRAIDPNIDILSFHPFTTADFIAFADAAPEILKKAEEDASAQLQLLPEQLAASFQGSLETALIRQEANRLLLEQTLKDGFAKIKDEIADEMKEDLKPSMSQPREGSKKRKLEGLDEREVLDRQSI